MPGWAAWAISALLGLADWKGGQIAREAKALVPSGWLWAEKKLGPLEILYQAMLSQAVRCRDPYVELRGEWILRRLAPDCTRISLTSLPDAKDELRLLRAMGWETANVHLGTPDATKAVRQDLSKRPKKWLLDAMEHMTESTTRDWKAWKKERERVRVTRYLGAAMAAGILVGASNSAAADEGMWTYNALPKPQIQQKYGFTITDAWAAHLQHASVRFVGSASGSFISADGLVMTNHHVGLGTLQKLSDATHDYVQNGFYARTRADEIKAPDLELETLDHIVPVTAEVESAVQPAMTAPQAFLARRTVIASLEKDAQAKTGLRCQVVTLYGGARYDLYCYKRYTDIRLVMAPEANTAFFGGDPDNFEYPRYDLDMCFFRAYENGQPAKISDYLAWNKDGPKEGDLVFVSGHPGRTSRLQTVSDLTYQRDISLPASLNVLRRREVLWTSWGKPPSRERACCPRPAFWDSELPKEPAGAAAGLAGPGASAAKAEAGDGTSGKGRRRSGA